MNDKLPLGVQVTALFRNLSSEVWGSKYGISWKEIEKVSKRFDEIVQESDWVDTDNGTTFDKSLSFIGPCRAVYHNRKGE